MKNPIAMKAGRPTPLGATFDGAGVNFALFSQHGARVTLCLFDERNRETGRIDLPERDGHVWHGYVAGLRPGQRVANRLWLGLSSKVLHGPNQVHGHTNGLTVGEHL